MVHQPRRKKQNDILIEHFSVLLMVISIKLSLKNVKLSTEESKFWKFSSSFFLSNVTAFHVDFVNRAWYRYNSYHFSRH